MWMQQVRNTRMTRRHAVEAGYAVQREATAVTACDTRRWCPPSRVVSLESLPLSLHPADTATPLDWLLAWETVAAR
jgi:hypothetical protein